jgi:hypothetical protein
MSRQQSSLERAIQRWWLEREADSDQLLDQLQRIRREMRLTADIALARFRGKESLKFLVIIFLILVESRQPGETSGANYGRVNARREVLSYLKALKSQLEESGVEHPEDEFVKMVGSKLKSVRHLKESIEAGITNDLD